MHNRVLTSKVLSSLFYCTVHCGTSAPPGWLVPQTAYWAVTLDGQVKVSTGCAHKTMSTFGKEEGEQKPSYSLRGVMAWTCWWDGGNDAHPPPVCKWAPNDVCAAISLSLSAAQLLVFAGKRSLTPSQSPPLTQRCMSTQIAMNSYLTC